MNEGRENAREREEWRDRVVLVTGAAGHLGEAVVRRFLETGARLALTDLDRARLTDRFPELEKSGGHLLVAPVNLTDPVALEGLREAVLDRWGRLDILLNLAGGYQGGTPLHETSPHEWDRLMDLNARSVFLTCRTFIPQMVAQQSGRIVNVASRAATHGGALVALYAASKTVVVRLTESLAEELKEVGITVNCVLPGIIDTPVNRAAMPQGDPKRWVSPVEIAEVILFLASDRARAVTGASLPVYGRG
jgi:NAD(P)-dependent dehydrogenase (short-subunit alcohol dehydrogenase family)